MTPSRRAHGQMSSSLDAEQVHRGVGHDRAGQQLLRAAGRDARAARPARPRVIVASRGTHVEQALVRRTRAHVRPVVGRRGAGHPGQRAERLGRARPRGRAAPARITPTQVAGDLRPDVLAQRRAPRPGRAGRRCSSSPGQPAGAQRQRVQAASGSSSGRRPSRASRRRCRARAAAREDQPNQRRTARKVSRASSSPDSTCRSTPVSAVTRVEHRLAVGRLADRARWRRRACPRRPCPRRPQRARATNGASRSRAVGSIAPCPSSELGQPQLGLVRVRRQRGAPDVGVDDQQVHGVGPDVEDTRVACAATRIRLRSARPLRTDPVPEVDLDFPPRRGSSSPTPPTPSSASAAT